jgi:hypothetical protein
MSKYRIWTSDNLYAPFNFKEIKKCNVRNVRFEAKGLGAAQIDVDLNNYSANLRDQFTSGNFTDSGIDDISTNKYIFIQDSDLIPGALAPDDPEYDATQDPSSSSYVLPNPGDSSVFWWGYISARSLEVQAHSNDMKGSLECLEVGHRINKFKIRHPKFNQNGFNPKVDGRWIGNKNPTTLSFNSNPSSMATNPSDTSKYWTIKQVVEYLVHYGVPYQIGVDWTAIEDSFAVGGANRWVEQYEEIPSYEGSDLTGTLEDILDTLSWTYYWSVDDEELKIRFLDPVGEMDDAYVTAYAIPPEAKEFTITSEEQAFEKLVLRGNRVLVAGSVSTYGGKEHVRVKTNWTDGEATTYTNPNGTAFNINTIDDSITNTISTATATDIPESAKENPVETEKDKIFNELKATREKTPNVYQHFLWGMADPSNINISGNCLFTSKQPGNWDNEKKINAGTDLENQLFPFFPRMVFQNPETTYTTQIDTGETDLLGEPIMRTITTPKKIDDLVYDVPIFDNTKNLHQTPIATELEFNDVIPWKPYEKDNEWFNQPRFYYRTLGTTEEYDNGIVASEAWQYGDMSGDGLMSSEVSYEWNGIKIKSPHPECFACPYDYLFQMGQLPNDEYDTTLQDFGFQRTEWKEENAISKYDPYRGNYGHKGHWGRLIFSFAAYSNQRIELSYGQDTSTDKVKFEEDDSLDLWIIRKGFVPFLDKSAGTGGSGLPVTTGNYVLPYYQPDDLITKNDMSIAKDRLKTLWAFWSKPKKAVKIVLPLFNTQGNTYTPGVSVGNFFDTVRDTKSNSTTWAVNSYIASIEFSFDSMSPSITISTEYPESPRRTRERRLKSSWKMNRFNEKEVSQKGWR